MMNTRPPLSPMSIAGSEWSGISSYKSPTESDSTMSMLRKGSTSGPSIGQSSNTSPPSSIARSSDGMRLHSEDSPNGHLGGPPGGPGRARMPPPRRGTDKTVDMDEIQKQHSTLKVVLDPFIAANKSANRPSKATDKLLRLTQVQFHELSTDVFDELQRRQGAGDRLSGVSTTSRAPQENADGSAPYLLPKASFHPKRNQARQKLSTLASERFRVLALDVFYELERRFPQFSGASISRNGSPASLLRNGSPSSVDGRPTLNPNGMSRPGALGVPGGPPTPGGPNGVNSFGRPLPKNVPGPGKSTLADDDDDIDDDDDEDAFGLEDRFRRSQGMKRANTGLNGRDSMASNTSSNRAGGASSEADRRLIADYKNQVTSLTKKLDQVEIAARDKDAEIRRLREAEENWKDDEEELKSVQQQLKALQGHNENALQNKNREFADLKNSLESRLREAQTLNDSMQSELERLRNENRDYEEWQENHVCQNISMPLPPSNGGNPELERKYHELLRANQDLKQELQDQQETTEQVRKQAMSFLSEMKALSAGGIASVQSQEESNAEIARLKDEARDWKARYTKAKTALRTLRAASIGLQYATETNVGKAGAHTDPNGLVKDIHVTKMQVTIDEILRSARVDPQGSMVHMKAVAAVVKAMTNGVEATQPPDDVLKMTMKVTATGHNLITAIRNHAVAEGLSPVSLVDAAASHLTASIVELAKRVKVRPTPQEELDTEEQNDAEADDDFDTDLLSVPSKSMKNTPAINAYSPARTSIESMYSTSSLSSRYSNNRSTRNPSGNWAGIKREGKFSALNPLGINNMASYESQQEQRELEELKTYLIRETSDVTEHVYRVIEEIRSDNPQLPTLRATMDEVIMVLGKIIQSIETAMEKQRSITFPDDVGQTVQSLEERLNGMLMMKTEDLENMGAASKDFTGRLARLCFGVTKETKDLTRIVEELTLK